MDSTVGPATGRSLAAARDGDVFRINRILFAALGNLCRELGVGEGSVIRCRSAAAAYLLLVREDGHAVLLERDWARFIRVVDPPDGKPGARTAADA